MTANLFAAFSVEAYLDHLGAHRLRCWRGLERLPVESKLLLLLEDLEQKPDFSRRPFATFTEMVRFRNALAHGKTQNIEESSVQKLLIDERTRYPQADLETKCDQKTATRFREDAEAIMRELQTWAGLDTTFMFATGLSSSETSRIEEIRSEKRSKGKP